MRLLQNKFVLYAVVVLSLLSVLTIRTNHLVLFVAIALMTYYYSRNMVIVLGVPLVVVHLLASYHYLENMDTMDSSDLDLDLNIKKEKPEEKEKIVIATEKIQVSPLDGTEDNTTIEDIVANANNNHASDLTEAYTNMGMDTWANETQKYQKSLMAAVHNIAPSLARANL